MNDPVHEAIMRAQGFFRAARRSTCGLCVARGEDRAASKILSVDWVRIMPDRWRPDLAHRWAHAYCVQLLLRDLSDVAGVEVIP
jgi:hypothetical protein